MLIQIISTFVSEESPFEEMGNVLDSSLDSKKVRIPVALLCSLSDIKLSGKV